MCLLYTLNDIATTDLTDFERGMIVGLHLARALVMGTADILGHSRSTVSVATRTYTKVGEMGTGKHNSGQKRKLTDKNKQVLKHIVGQKHKQLLPKITSDMNSYLQNSVSAKTIKIELHNANIYSTMEICKLLVTSRNAFK